MISAADRREATMLIQEAQASGARLIPACQVLHISVRTYERWIAEGEVKSDGRPMAQRPKPRNSLSDDEEKAILDTVNSPEYASKPPSQIVPDLADKGKYIASESTFYRVLRRRKLLAHRGRSRPPTSRQPTTYIATAPNQVWSWDITFLPGPVKGIYYKLYMVLDIFSRKIIAWEVWEDEKAEYAAKLIRMAKAREAVRHTLVLHSDNGSPMKAASFQATLANLGITPSYSRPRVSNDNPYSEAHFKTVKYRPNYPSKGFLDLSQARDWIHSFITWYHEEHRHSGIGFVTPIERHSGQADAIHAKRNTVYKAARERNPERWSRHTRNWVSPPAVALNPEREAHYYLGRASGAESQPISSFSPVAARGGHPGSPSSLGVGEP